MNRVIYKHVIGFGSNVLYVSPCWKPLTVQLQLDSMTLWYETDIDAEIVDKTVAVYGTGQSLSDFSLVNQIYVDTIQIGTMVWHIYAEKGNV